MRDVIIVGAGPAGLSAAIYLKRYGLDVAILEKTMIGGQVAITNRVDNYLGFFNITGLELSDIFKKHMESLEIEVIRDEVLNIKKDNNFFIEGKKNNYQAKYVLVATGRVHKNLGLKDENKFIGKGISFCATCDAPMARGKSVIVVGGGNSAFEETLYISQFAESVKILVRSTVKADSYLEKEVRELPNVEVLLEEEISQFVGEDHLEKVITNKGEYPADLVFIYIGLSPQVTYLNDLDIEFMNNHIKVDENFKTNIDGLYAAGDVTEKKMYQIATCVAEGAEAAFSIYQDNKKNKV